MKKFLRYALYVVGIVIVLAGAFAAFVAIRGIPKYKAETLVLSVTSSPERVARGQKLATMLCRSCHFDGKTGKFSGHEMKEAPQFGTIFSRNITRDPEAGIGKWTDGQLAVLLRTGVKPDGTYLPPYMPKLINVSDEDLQSVIAFLRSDHPWVQPDKTVQPLTRPSFLTKFLTNIGALKPFDMPKQAIAGPDTSNTVAWGRYISVGQLECFSCHSADFAKNDYFKPEQSPGYFGGGNEMYGPDGNKIQSRNITMDEETGIGKWTEEQFITAVKHGKGIDGKALRPPMQPYSELTDGEAKAIYAYLKTIPKIRNEVPRK